MSPFSNASLELIKGATITGVSNTNDNQERFTIWVCMANS
ncbi:DUF5992 family protein [Teredinibacter sp. KSP-S5-2]